MEHPIDLIIPWVDGSDPEWQKEKEQYAHQAGDQRALRFRDWGLMRYWFRGVEQCLPWIRTVHFVTFGHLPEWLDTGYEKLHIVCHQDYLPAEYRPTFSSHPIELNFHRIEGLAEHFIYANDDTFFLQPKPREFFFKNGLPVDAAIQNVLQFYRPDGISHIVANNLECINLHFDKRKTMRKNHEKWFSGLYGRQMLHNFYLRPFRHFTGFSDPHLPCAYLKETWREVWARCGERLEESSRRAIRSNEDVNQWVFRYWQLASGNFIPGDPDRGRFFAIGRDDPQIEAMLQKPSMPMVCLSDDDEHLSFETEKAFLQHLFEGLFPGKSKFER